MKIMDSESFQHISTTSSSTYEYLTYIEKSQAQAARMMRSMASRTKAVGH
jgi:hypothetical protein